MSSESRKRRMASRWGIAAAAFMIAQQVGGKATRDALFLSSFEAAHLPWIVIVSAALSLVTALLASRLFLRWGPQPVVPMAFIGSSVFYGIEYGLALYDFKAAVAVMVYLHTAAFGALVISGFWSVINERFDPHTAKKVIGRIGAGATAGGVFGGLLSERIGALSDVNTMLLVLAVLNAWAAFCVRRIGISMHTRPSLVALRNTSPMLTLRQESYLRLLGALVLLTAVSAGLLDFALKAKAAEEIAGGEALLSFFALFHTITGVVSLIFQTGLARPSVQKLGPSGTVALLPGSVAIIGGIAAFFPFLGPIVAARGAAFAFSNSLFRSGYELLYTPVAPEKKRSTKAVIDVALSRFGDAMASGALLLLFFLQRNFPALVPSANTLPLILGVAAATGAGTLYVAFRLHKGYVGELEVSLKSGAVQLYDEEGEEETLQAATWSTVSGIGLDRDELLDEIGQHSYQSWLEQMSKSRDEGDPDAAVRELAKSLTVDAQDPLARDIAALRSGDPEKIRKVVNKRPVEAGLTPFLIAVLARKDTSWDVIQALREIGWMDPKPLLTALIDPEQPFSVRRRMPRVLEVLEGDDIVDGLGQALSDERFEVRYRAGVALSRIAERGVTAVDFATHYVNEQVLKEAKRGREVWNRRRLLDEDDEDAPMLNKAARSRVQRSVEHVFTLLSLGYETEPLKLALHSLVWGDAGLKGTALEYLENILPKDICLALFPMLDVGAAEMRRHESRPSRIPRARHEIIDEMRFSTSNYEIDVAMLVKIAEGYEDEIRPAHSPSQVPPPPRRGNTKPPED